MDGAIIVSRLQLSVTKLRQPLYLFGREGPGVGRLIARRGIFLSILDVLQHLPHNRIVQEAFLLHFLQRHLLYHAHADKVHDNRYCGGRRQDHNGRRRGKHQPLLFHLSLPFCPFGRRVRPKGGQPQALAPIQAAAQ